MAVKKAPKKTPFEQVLNGMVAVYKVMTKSVHSVHATVFAFFLVLLFLESFAENTFARMHTKEVALFLIICALVIFLLKISKVTKIVDDGNGGTKEIEESRFFQLRKWFTQNPQWLFWTYFSLIGNFLYIALHR